jgi:hypothetical protein
MPYWTKHVGLTEYDYFMKPHTEMIEGPEAWDRFKSAMRAIVKVPKSALPPSPFGKKATKKTVARKVPNVSGGG